MTNEEAKSKLLEAESYYTSRLEEIKSYKSKLNNGNADAKIKYRLNVVYDTRINEISSLLTVLKFDVI